MLIRPVWFQYKLPDGYNSKSTNCLEFNKKNMILMIPIDIVDQDIYPG